MAAADRVANAGCSSSSRPSWWDELGEAGQIDLERVSVDSFGLRAAKGGAGRRQSD